MELLAMWHGLNLVWDRGFRQVICQSDSTEALALVLGVPPPRHRYAALIWSIKDLLSREWEVSMTHMLREGNSCADFLAKYGAMQDEPLVLPQEPLPGMTQLLFWDSVEFLFERG
ncbi:uncharacterized protein LOC130740433 [Lotus japonicus]|uniref:uncharacterized protein LOC130740433 n=1 Tax=Lotus japonicus TaxID=34305 RepID=UPI002590956A|nr:uncharacterized protein LOC130740433 [Lotus japonicus]